MSQQNVSPGGSRTSVVAVTVGERTRIEERPRPVPGRGELLLRVSCSGLCGTDLFKLAYGLAPAGTVLGHEIVGVVCGVGDGVEAFAAGERIVVPHHVACGRCALCARGSETLCPVFRENLLEPGGFSDYVLVRERAVRLAARKVPADITDEAAVFLEPAACVLRGIRRAGLPEPGREGPQDACAVVLGAGSMGLLHVLVLRALYPGLRIVVSDLRRDRLDLARDLGADDAHEPRGESLGDAVQTLSGGLGADAVFDTAGGSALMSAALEMTREGGSVVLFAHAPEGDRAAFDINTLFKNERRVLGTYSGALAEQDEVFELITSGRLDASRLVTHHLPFSRFDEGVGLCRRQEALKVLFHPLTPGQDSP